MANDEIEEFGLGTDPNVVPRSQNENDVTGRMEKEVKPVAVPSVVSRGKTKNALVAEESLLADKEKALNSLASDEDVQNQQTGAIEPQVTDINGKTSSDSTDLEITGKLTDSEEEDQASDNEGDDAIPASSTSLPISTSTGNLLERSGNIDEVSQKGIEIRKEQIQRAKKRAVDQKRKRTTRIVRRVVIIVLVLLMIASVSVFSIFRWGLHDDHVDIQGKWQIGDSNAQVTITEDNIKLNKEVSYSYSIDPFSKTLTFDFGQLKGSGRYRFSLDRNQISLLDGTFETTDTLAEDISWTLQAFWDYLSTSGITSPNLGDGSIVLNRVIED